MARASRRSAPRHRLLHLAEIGRKLRRGIELGTELFYSFKAGERALAYPFARSIARAIRKRRLGGFDCIVPIPLSLDKARKGELHRTKELAQKLSQRLELLKVTEKRAPMV